MADTTRLQLPLIAASQAQKHITHNEAVMRLDALVQMTAKSYTTAAQPAAPADGDLYLLPAGKTGSAWGGYANHAVAHYYDGIWHPHQPRAGWLCFVQDTAVLYYYTGTAWANVGAIMTQLLGDGSAGAPSLAFSGDPNTGLFRIGADTLGFAAGGTEGLRIDASGNVGEAGTFTPQLQFGGAAVGMTCARLTGHYLKIGRLVICRVDIGLSAKGSSTGAATLTGLPFVGANDSYSLTGGSISQYYGMAGMNGALFASVRRNSTIVDLFMYGTNVTQYTSITDAHVTDMLSLQLGFNYYAG